MANFNLNFFVRVGIFLGVFVYSVGIFVSCGSDRSKVDSHTDVATTLRTSSDDVFIGQIINSVPTITVSAQAVLTILSDWNDDHEGSDIPGELTSLAIEQYEGVYYAVARGNGAKSTRNLVVDENGNTFISIKITCKTIDCAADTGVCLPSGHICTKCSGMCERTATTVQ